jgi:hypothetical protein
LLFVHQQAERNSTSAHQQQASTCINNHVCPSGNRYQRVSAQADLAWPSPPSVEAGLHEMLVIAMLTDFALLLLDSVRMLHEQQLEPTYEYAH